MKIPLLLIIAASTAIVGCSSNSYPDSGKYPNPGSSRYPYPDSRQYPYPNNPQGRRDDQVVVTRDGRVIDRNGRVIGTTRNVPPNSSGKGYGSRSGKQYEQRRRNDDRYDKKRHDNDRYENSKYYKGKGKKGRSDHDDRN